MGAQRPLGRGAPHVSGAAWQRYSGSLYHAGNLSLRSLIQEPNQVLILSGCYGILCTDEAIAWYDRRMSSAVGRTGCFHGALKHMYANSESPKSGAIRDVGGLLQGDWPLRDGRSRVRLGLRARAAVSADRGHGARAGDQRRLLPFHAYPTRRTVPQAKARSASSSGSSKVRSSI